MRYPTPFQQKTLWNAATGVSILILGALMAGLIWLTGRVFLRVDRVAVAGVARLAAVGLRRPACVPVAKQPCPSAEVAYDSPVMIAVIAPQIAVAFGES